MPKVNHTPKELAELRSFGVFPGGKPILERQWEGREACRKCNGFGSRGIPMCGAVYKCKVCKGTGKRPGLLRRLLS